MGKITKRILALLLASLMILGAATAAAAAGVSQAPAPCAAKERQTAKGAAAGPVQQSIPAPGALKLSIKPGCDPTATEYLLGFEKPDLSGLVLEVEMNGKKFDAAWDEGSGGFYSNDMEYYWSLSIIDSELPAVPGPPTKIIVHFYGETFDYNRWEYITYAGTVDVTTVIALSLLDKKVTETELFVDTAEDTALEDLGGYSPNFYKFVPEADGFYALSASDFANDTRPFGALLKAPEGTVLGTMSNDLGSQPLVFYLEADVTYYYVVDYMYDKAPVAPGTYTLTLLVEAYTPATLTLDQAEELSLGGPNESYNGIFTFKPTRTGDYCFRSVSGGIDLAADLLDESMAVLAGNDDGETRYYTPEYYYSYTCGLDFKFVHRLAANATYYLSVRSLDGYFYDYGSDSNAGEIVVEEAYLRSPSGTVKAYYEEYPPFDSMFASNYDNIDITAGGDYFAYHKIYMPKLVRFGYGYVAAKIGNTTVSAVVLDSSWNPTNVKADANVRITYSWWQWLLVIFCFGWIWL